MLRALLLLILLSPPFAAVGDAAPQGRWQDPVDKADCQVWNAMPQKEETVTWSGGCRDGKAEGPGKMVWHYTDSGMRKQESYEGTVRAGLLHGQGIYLWADGARYEGGWKDGKLHGQGEIFYANGNGYRGAWQDDEMHGQGTFLFDDGDECDGTWRRDRLVGLGQGWRHSEGRILKCFQDGEMINFKD